jgi:hypothetical protein
MSPSAAEMCGVAVFERGFQVRRHVAFRGQMLGWVPRSSFYLCSLLSHDNLYCSHAKSSVQ